MFNANRFVLCGGKLLLVALLLGTPRSAAQAGGITGTIRDGITGAALGNIDLDVYDANFRPVLGIDDPGAPNTDVSAEDGTFVLEPLPTGKYYLRADPSVAQGFAVLYFPGVFLPSQAVPVDVRAAGLTPVDFYLHPGHELHGRIVDDLTDQPLPGVDLDVYSDNGTFISWVTAHTDSLGNFSVGLVPNGRFHLRADPEGGSMYLPEFYGGASSLDGSQPLLVVNNDVGGLEFRLDLGGSLNGIVTDRVTGAPLAQVDIDLFDANGNLLPWADAQTDAAGIYRVGSLPDGQYYVLADAAAEQGYVDTYYGDTSDLAGATAVAVSTGTTAADLSITMARGGTIGGTVTAAATAAPLANVQMTLWVGTQRVASAHTAADGTYLIGAVPAGDYVVRCAGVDDLGLAFQYHSGATLASQATPIPVVADSTVGGIDFALQPGGYMRGIVATKMGEPLAGATLDLYTPEGHSLPSLDAVTAADGTFLLGPIPAGTFVLRANPSQLHPQYTKRYYGGTDQLAAATALVVTSTDTLTGLDFLYGTIDRPQPRPAEIQEISATPNPFNPRTRIAFALDTAGSVKVTIHDVRGRVLAVLADGVLPAGRHELVWDGRGVLGQGESSGVHFVRVETATRVDKHKLILLK